MHSAKDCASASVQRYVRRSALSQPVMQWCIAFAASAAWGKPPRQLLELLACVARGWLQSRINEQGNKILREGEARNNASKACLRDQHLQALLSHVPMSASSSYFQLLPTSGHPSFHLQAFVCARSCLIVAAHERSVPLLLFFLHPPFRQNSTSSPRGREVHTNVAFHGPRPAHRVLRQDGG